EDELEDTLRRIGSALELMVWIQPEPRALSPSAGGGAEFANQSGREYLLAKKRQHQAAAKAEARLRGAAARVRARAGGHLADAREEAHPGGFKLALLVNRDHIGAVKRRVRLARGRGWTLRVTGPW